MTSRALITGITGQDGSYLAELLLEKGYEVHGLIRRSSSLNTGRIDHLLQDPNQSNARLFLHYGDLTDTSGLSRLIEKVVPNEIYHLAAQSHVRVSFDTPEYTADVTGIGTLRILEAMRETQTQARFYQASSSEMFGSAKTVPQDEATPFHPRSPYGCAKAFAYWCAVNYREAYDLHISNGILFNHESPRRGESFVTRKITRAIAQIIKGHQSELYLGNLEAKRDWGYAPDYVEAMWRMLQQPTGDDFVIATGVAHSVRDFLVIAFGLVGLNYEDYVKVDARYFRPTDMELLAGDARKAERILGWKPTTAFPELVRMMVEADLRSAGLEPETHLKIVNAGGMLSPKKTEKNS